MAKNLFNEADFDRVKDIVYSLEVAKSLFMHYILAIIKKVGAQNEQIDLRSLYIDDRVGSL
jgi:ACT domain-containing protein